MILPGRQSLLLGGAPIKPASYVFNGTNEYLARTLVTISPSTTTFTWSFWAKTVDTENGFWTLLSNNVAGNTFALCQGTIDEQMWYREVLSGSGAFDRITGNNVMDVAGNWIHYVYRIQTSNPTTANRVRLYRNGVQQTETDGTEPGASEVTNMFTNGHSMFVGNLDVVWMAKSMAFMDLLEGVSAGPDAFAFDDGGTWTRKPYTGSYGTYGFRLDGSDGFNDVSGNGQNFTGVNMDETNLNFADLPPFTL